MIDSSFIVALVTEGFSANNIFSTKGVVFDLTAPCDPIVFTFVNIIMSGCSKASLSYIKPKA